MMGARFRHICFWICVLAPLMLLTACSSRETVVIYSPHGADVLRDYETRFEQAYPEVDVQWLDMGANTVYTRIQAEQQRPAGDIWWGATSTLFKQAVADDLLAAYRPSWADAVDNAYHDAANHWYATYLSALAILYNKNHYSAEDLPNTWDGLLTAQWQGKISIRKPHDSGTMRTFICAMIDRAPTEDQGIAWLRQFHQSTTSYPESPFLLFDHIKKNPERISVWLQPDIVMQRKIHGFPVDFVVPPQTPVIVDGIAIIKNAPHRSWAEKFYEFVTSKEELIHQAEAYAKYPVRNDIPKSELPDWMQSMTLDPMDIDWDHFAANEKRWCTRWDQEVYSAHE